MLPLLVFQRFICLNVLGNLNDLNLALAGLKLQLILVYWAYPYNANQEEADLLNTQERVNNRRMPETKLTLHLL